MRFFLFFICALLSACATTGYQKQVNEWRGKHIQTLRYRWGCPNAIIDLPNGHTLYQYTRKTFYTLPDSKRQTLYANTNTSLFSNYEKPWVSNPTVVSYCRTTFETNRNGIIIRVDSQGNCPTIPTVFNSFQ
jgi:hypothetical protein